MIDSNCHPFAVLPGAFDPSKISLDVHPDTDRPRRLAQHGPFRTMQELLLSRLALQLGCARDEVLDVRASVASADWPGYVASLFRAADLTDLVMDASYPPGAADRIASYATLSGCRVHPTKRIDIEVDAAIAAGASANDVFTSVTEAMVESAPKIVAFKSILAYRTGLAIDPLADEKRANASLNNQDPVRRRGKACRDWILRQALGVAAELKRPMQIHAGLGDSDLRLKEADPLLLEPLLATPEASAGRIVLIHGAYPWHESLASLVSGHVNIWADLSMTNLYSPVTFASRVLRLMELAPTNRLMLGTDGHDEPEVFWFGAQVLKDGWATVEKWLGVAGVRAAEIDAARQSMFGATAGDLYGL